MKAYQKNFPNFICGSPISIEVSGQSEKTKAKPSGVVQKEEVKTKEP